MTTALPTSLADASKKDGDFYVEPDCCLLCGVPEDIAPDIFETGKHHCSLKRQPCRPEDLDLTIRAMWSSEVDCIRYRGRDPALLDRLTRAGLAHMADHSPEPNAMVHLRDRVRFEISAETLLPAKAPLIAAMFRADMRAQGSRVLPGFLGPKTVRVSWFQFHFHSVRFADREDGSIIASLRSNQALQGLAWRVDDWLRAKNAHAIRWEARGDATSSSPKPM